ncbi:hypothetical protein QBC37DRAFT_414371 [Rhypophila decipiens]|uniref:DUF1275 domain-containing protein n=1 Tax=Rhypophila decipiens TaxID=261697 RepID=A0AAN7BBY2_9PEZI|nr:hypothetical protein QBC37DRAFT_414371 [Rhypophila decipiens]
MGPQPPNSRVNSSQTSLDTLHSEPASAERTSFSSRTWKYLNAPVRPCGFVELQLLVTTFCTGLQDAVSFPDFHCFASNQTGNTVFLMLAIALPEMNGEWFLTSNIGMALGMFIAGALITGQLGHIIGRQRRLWLIFCNLIQTAMVFATAGIQYVHGIDLEGPKTPVCIALLAFAAGSQVVQSRSLEMTEITTAMATAAWLDLIIDRRILAVENRSRNRRAAFLASLVLGSLAGAYMFKNVGSPAAIAVSGAGKLLVTVMFFFSPAEEEKKKTEKEGELV